MRIFKITLDMAAISLLYSTCSQIDTHTLNLCNRLPLHDIKKNR